MWKFLSYLCICSIGALITPSSGNVSAQVNLQGKSFFGNHHLAEVGNISQLRCPPWSYFDFANKMCKHDIYFAALFYNNHTHLRVGYCSTYNEKTGIVSFSSCPYFQSDGFNVSVIRESNFWSIQLPENISTLNEYMCGSLNRIGNVCSECARGFGPAVTSLGFNLQCSYCNDNWYGLLLYLFLEFIPVTVFYIVILVFRINITSAPMTCYIMYSQLVAVWWSFAFEGEDLNINREMFKLNSHTELFRKFFLAMYDMWNLRFFYYLVPPFCISSKLKPFHVGLLGYISIFYPICLVLMTWICVELHDRRCRLLVWLWKPFHRCLVRLRRSWNSKSDIIDVFSSFFLLSFTKVMYQTALFLTYHTIDEKHYSNLQSLIAESGVTMIDLTVKYGSFEHLMYVVPAVLFMCIFNVIPIAILFFYPFKAFQTCLSKCRLNGLVLKHFVDKFYGCYRDDPDGGKDMRSFAALYFFVRPLILLAGSVATLLTISNTDPYFPRSIILVLALLLIALCRPYKKTYMNVLDSLLLAHFAISCQLVSSYSGFQEHHSSFVYTCGVMLAIPFITFVSLVTLRALGKACSTHAFKELSQKCKSYLCCCITTKILQGEKNSECCSTIFPTEQPLVEPNNPEVSYGSLR